MAKKKLIKLGSRTAKKGFRNEKDIVKKFNNCRTYALKKYLLRQLAKISYF